MSAGVTSSATGRGEAPATSSYKFQSLLGLASKLSFTLTALAILVILAVANAVHALSIASNSVALEAAQTRATVLLLLDLALGVVTTSLFVSLLSQANRNARAFGASPLEFTPRKAGNTFFLPIGNLYQPYRAMKEVWRATQAGGTVPWQTAKVPLMLPLWWGSLLVSAAVWLITSMAPSASSTSADTTIIFCVRVAATAISVLSALLAAAIVRGLGRRHEVRAREIAQQGGPSSLVAWHRQPGRW
jgi:Domain of unknown function (DUF4328)